jgi:hypothetical protein
MMMGAFISAGGPHQFLGGNIEGNRPGSEQDRSAAQQLYNHHHVEPGRRAVRNGKRAGHS